jgi:tetratricopeptide (TPR) repeat protein
MNAGRRAACALAGALALAGRLADAQTPPPQAHEFEVVAEPPLDEAAPEARASDAGEDGFDAYSPAELRALEAFAALRGGEPIRARELAQQLLREDAESVEGHILLGSVLYESEGDLARARHLLREGKRLYERAHAGREVGEDVRIWHAYALRTLGSVSSEMGREEEALAYQQEWQSLYGDGGPSWSAWVLMRLGRLEEARAVAQNTLAQAQDVDGRDSARAALCAIAAEQLDREAAYQACVGGAYQSQEEGGSGAVPWSNAAEAAGMALKLDEIERLLLEATRYGVEDFVNPWSDLVFVYTAQGRLAEATAALREMVEWRERQEANVRAQTWAHADLAAASFLLAAGRTADAERILARALAAPDRHGSSNEDPEQRMAATALLGAAVLRTRAEEKREEASWLPLWRALPAWLHAAWLDLRAWLTARRAIDGLSHERFLMSTLRPYLADQITLPEWLQPDLVRVLGPGLASAGLAEARAVETHPFASGWFEALETEIAALRGDEAATGEHARRALIELPQAEVLLRARAAARHGDAALREGDVEGSVAAYALALQRDPGVVRRLGLALPVTFAVSGGALAEEAAGHLRASPRLAEAAGGFRVEVHAEGASARACLLGAHGERLGCGRVSARAGEDASARARRLAAAFHEGLFSARLSLSQVDLRSLDGSPLTGGRGSVELGVPELFQEGAAPRATP